MILLPSSLTAEAPPLARIDQVTAWDEADGPFTGFEIRESESVEGAFQPVSPDVALCPDCERELLDPNDRRYLYSFINCTNCGPRFTIIKDLPYDRPATTMADFPMCDACRAEYEDPRQPPLPCPAGSLSRLWAVCPATDAFRSCFKSCKYRFALVGHCQSAASFCGRGKSSPSKDWVVSTSPVTRPMRRRLPSCADAKAGQASRLP